MANLSSFVTKQSNLTLIKSTKNRYCINTSEPLCQSEIQPLCKSFILMSDKSGGSRLEPNATSEIHQSFISSSGRAHLKMTVRKKIRRGEVYQ